MERTDIEKYINQLKELDMRINPDDSPDTEITEEFISTMDRVLHSLGKDIEKDMIKTTEIGVAIPVRFMKLKPNAVTPSYAKDGDAGLDLSAADIISETGTQIAYGTGIAIEIPRGYVGLVFPRSSVRNYSLSLANCVGIVDSGYRGEIVLTFNKKYLEVFGIAVYKVSDRIGQLVIIPYPQIQLIEAEELSTTERNTGGHGHTGT